jgi:hypothetical protein
MVDTTLWSCAITKMERHWLTQIIHVLRVTGQFTCTISILSQLNIIRYETLEGLSTVWRLG